MIIDNVIVQCPYFNDTRHFTTGLYGVVKIEYNEARGEGDRHFVDVSFGDVTTRYFEIKALTYRK